VSFLIRPKPPSWADYNMFRSGEGWGHISQARAVKAIENALYWVSLYDGDPRDKTPTLVGFGRIIGDGALNYYIQDLIVHPAYRGRGAGSQLMQALMRWLQIYAKGATVGLMSVAGAEDFYAHYGFKSRPIGRLGAGMTLDISTSFESR